MATDVPYVTTESGGLRAWVDGYVLDGGTVYYLSIFGAVGAVKAVSAALVSGNIIELWEMDELGKNLYRQWGKVKYRMISKRLPSSRMLSMVILIDSATLSDDHDFMIITKKENPKELLYRNLVHRSEMPLHSSWKEWLWATFKHFEWITALEGYKMRGYSISYNDDDLADALEVGIKTRRIPEVNNGAIRIAD